MEENWSCPFCNGKKDYFQLFEEFKKETNDLQNYRRSEIAAIQLFILWLEKREEDEIL